MVYQLSGGQVHHISGLNGDGTPWTATVDGLRHAGYVNVTSAFERGGLRGVGLATYDTDAISAPAYAILAMSMGASRIFFI